MTDPFLALAGAVESPGTGVPAHYGAPLAEQRALETGSAIVDLAHHGILTVTGQDRLSWLHSMTSQHLVGLAPGESAETLLLGPTGRVEHDIRLVDDGERSWLLVDEGSVGSLAEYLNRMRFALRVEVADVSSEYAAVLVFDGPARAALRELGTAVVEWRDPWGTVARGGTQYAHGEHPGAGWSATQLVFRRADLDAVAALTHADSLGTDSLRAAGLLALDALEIRAARPTLSSEVDERAIPHEFDWLRSAVHLTKGCYRGQETIAKVHNLGHPPRRLTLLHLDGSGGELPASGALVHLADADAGARPVGRITRAALHHEWGGIALALLKRSVPEDATLAVDLGTAESADAGAETGTQTDTEARADTVAHNATARSGERIAATQEIIVPADAGSVRDIPKLRRL